MTGTSKTNEDKALAIVQEHLFLFGARLAGRNSFLKSIRDALNTKDAEKEDAVDTSVKATMEIVGARLKVLSIKFPVEHEFRTEIIKYADALTTQYEKLETN